MAPRRSRQSWRVRLMAGTGSLVLVVTGCGRQAEIERLEKENLELRKQLVSCEHEITKAKAKALDCELGTLPFEHEYPLAVPKPAGSDGAPDACACEPGDPHCSCQ